MSDEGQHAVARRPAELRELADASDRKQGREEERKVWDAADLQGLVAWTTLESDKQKKRKASSSGKWFPKPRIFCEGI